MDEHRHTDETILAELRALKELHGERFSRIDEFMRDNKKQNETFQTRINIMELWQANSLGKLTVISVAIGVGISVLVAWITKHIT